MKKGYHKGQELTMSELGLSLEELAGQPLELFAREGAKLQALPCGISASSPISGTWKDKNYLSDREVKQAQLNRCIIS